MERLKAAMHGELEAFSHQAGNFITRSHSEFIRQQEEKYAARAKTPPTEGSSAWTVSEPEEEVFYGPTLQRLPAPPPPPTSSSWNFQHRTAPVQRNTTPQRPPSPVSIYASAYRGFNSRGDDGGGGGAEPCYAREYARIFQSSAQRTRGATRRKKSTEKLTGRVATTCFTACAARAMQFPWRPAHLSRAHRMGRNRTSPARRWRRY